MSSVGTQSDSAQPLLYNIYKLNSFTYRPDNRVPYERTLNDHLRPGPIGRPRSMYASMQSIPRGTEPLVSTPRPLTMVQSRPSSAQHLATTGRRIQMMMQATVYPRSGSDQPENEPLPVRTPRRSILNAKREKERLAHQLHSLHDQSHHPVSGQQATPRVRPATAPCALTSALKVMPCSTPGTAGWLDILSHARL